MQEHAFTKHAPSRRLPPLEAWKKPDKWIDLSTGLAKPDVSKLVFDTDDRGFLNTDQAVEQVEDMFFWKDYDWPFIQDDPETAPDDHHFYYFRSEYLPQNNDGNIIPIRFREIPTVIGTMPRQFHNTIHDFTKKPNMPDMEHMEQYYRSYILAYRAFKNLIESAKNTTKASQMFTRRQQDLQNGGIELPEAGNAVAQEIMRDFFAKHFKAYSRSIDEVMSLDQRSLVVPDIEDISQYKPHVAVKKLGKYIARNTINYTTTLRGA